MITHGSIVMFIPEYSGYYKELKDKKLTVNQVFPADKHDESKVTLVNINEMHLINAKWFKEVKNETIN